MRFPYRCPAIDPNSVSNTHAACAEQFGSVHAPRLRIVESADDGDCLFHALVNYGLAMNFVPFLKSEQAIRFELVDYMIEHFEEYKESIGIKNDKPANQTIDDNRMLQIYEMATPKVWSTDVGDLFPKVISDCYGLNVIIYNIVESEHSMVRHIHDTKFIHAPGSPVIYLLRIHNNHFNLFLPADVVGPNFSNAARNNQPAAAAASSSNINKQVNKIKHNVNNLSRKLHRVKLSNRSNNNANLAAAIAASKQEALSATKKKKNNNNANLAAAIAASLVMNNNSKNDVNNIFNLSKKKKLSKKVAQSGEAAPSRRYYTRSSKASNDNIRNNKPPVNTKQSAIVKKSEIMKQKLMEEIGKLYQTNIPTVFERLRNDIISRIQRSRTLIPEHKKELLDFLPSM
jgi:hypothetical protein